MVHVTIECRCDECLYWKKKKYLKHDGICTCQTDEDEVQIPKKDTDFCNYAKKEDKTNGTT